MVLITHTADLHIGAFANRPLRSACVDALEEIARYTIENDAEYLVIAGDLFEKPRIESFELLRRVYRILRVLRDNGVYVVVSPGSHDSSSRGNDLLTLLEEAGLVYKPPTEVGEEIISKPLRLGELAFYSIPGLKNNLEIDYLRRGKVLLKDIDRVGGNAIVLLHTSVRFAGYDPSVYSSRYGRGVIEGESVLKSIPEQVRYIALGHIHFPTPIFDKAEANIVYPGAPVGRDANDLYETYLLSREYGKKRRFLTVDLGENIPVVHSVWSSFGVLVEYYRGYYRGFDEEFLEIKRVLKDMSEDGYRVLIVDLEGVPIGDRNRLIQAARELEHKTRVLIHLRLKSMEEQSIVDFTVDEIGDIEALERVAVRELVEKMGVRADPEKIIELIDILGREKPIEVSKDMFYNNMLSEVKRLMREILGVE